jgi:hypothetical protein
VPPQAVNARAETTAVTTVGRSRLLMPIIPLPKTPLWLGSALDKHVPFVTC